MRQDISCLYQKNHKYLIMNRLNIFANTIDKHYEKYKETKFYNRLFKHKDIVEQIEGLKKCSFCKVEEIGKSVENREIFSIKIGRGKTVVLLWSQMHGNEPTATPAIFDILNFLTANDENNSYRSKILDELTLYFVPMLNPDGTNVYTRQNALSIDINRDAKALQSLEAQLLKQIRDDIKAEFGFNLHDQSIYYSAGDSGLPATISFLSPSFNKSKDINEKRISAMQLIVLMNEILQQRIKGQIGRYYDDFMPNSFGDNMMLWGTSTILVESGGYRNDPDKQHVRKMNYLALLSALYSIANNSFKNVEYKNYFNLPVNAKEKLFDLLIKGVNITRHNKNYTVDIGIRREEVFNKTDNLLITTGRISQVGDLSLYSGYEALDGKNLKFHCENDQKIPKLNDNADFYLLNKDNKKVYEIKNGFLIS